MDSVCNAAVLEDTEERVSVVKVFARLATWKNCRNSLKLQKCAMDDLNIYKGKA